MRLAPDRANRWTVLQERLRQEAEDAATLSQHSDAFPVLTRLRRIQEAMRGALLTLTTEFEGR